MCLTVIRYKKMLRRDRIDDTGQASSRARAKEDQKSARLLSRTAKRCPHCTILITKNDGCDHMTCAFCGRSFDWTQAQAPPVSSDAINQPTPYLDNYRRNAFNEQTPPQFDNQGGVFDRRPAQNIDYRSQSNWHPVVCMIILVISIIIGTMLLRFKPPTLQLDIKQRRSFQ